MSTSASDREKILDRLLLIDLLLALFCALFGGVYEAFSHGVWSYCMIYAFTFPLALGVLPLFVLRLRHAPLPSRFARTAWHAGIASLTVGSLVTGALEIYGTSHPLTVLYWIAGGALLLVGAAAYGTTVAKRARGES